MKTQNFLLQFAERRFRDVAHDYLGSAPRQGLTRRLTRYLLEAQGFGNPKSMHESGEEYFLNWLRPTVGLVLDVGASNGEYSRLALTSGSSCTVHAVETLTIYYDELRKTEREWPERFSFQRSAVGAKRGTSEIHYHRHSPSSATLNLTSLEDDGTKVSSEMVEVQPIDEIIRSQGGDDLISLIKIDVEGFEWEALAGASKTIERERSVFQVEISQLSVVTGSSVYAIVSEFFGGWTTYRLLRGRNGLIPVDHRSHWANLPIFSNIVLIPPTLPGNAGLEVPL